MATRPGGNPQQPQRRNHVPAFGQWQSGNVNETVPYTAVFDRAHAAKMFDENGHLIVPRSAANGESAGDSEAAKLETSAHDPYAIPTNVPSTNGAMAKPARPPDHDQYAIPTMSIPGKPSAASAAPALHHDPYANPIRDPYASPVHDPYASPAKPFPKATPSPERVPHMVPREQRQVAAAAGQQQTASGAAIRRHSSAEGGPNSASFRTWTTPQQHTPQQQQQPQQHQRGTTGTGTTRGSPIRTSDSPHSPSASPSPAVRGVGPMNPVHTPWSSHDSKAAQAPPAAHMAGGSRQRMPLRSEAEEEAAQKAAYDKWQNDVISNMEGNGELTTEALPSQFLPPPSFDDVMLKRRPSPGPGAGRAAGVGQQQQALSVDADGIRRRKTPTPSPPLQRPPHSSADDDEVAKKASYDKWMADSIMHLKGQEITTEELPSNFLPPPRPDQFLQRVPPPPAPVTPGKGGGEGRRASGSGPARASNNHNNAQPQLPNLTPDRTAPPKVHTTAPPAAKKPGPPAPPARMPPPRPAPPRPASPPQPSGCFSCFARH